MVSLLFAGTCVKRCGVGHVLAGDYVVVGLGHELHQTLGSLSNGPLAVFVVGVGTHAHHFHDPVRSSPHLPLPFRRTARIAP
jgi:hypothetical protein